MKAVRNLESCRKGLSQAGDDDHENASALGFDLNNVTLDDLIHVKDQIKAEIKKLKSN